MKKITLVSMLIAVAVLTEIFVFNMRSIESAFRNANEIDLTDRVILSQDIIKNENNTITALKRGGDNTLEIQGINAEIKSIYIDITRVNIHNSLAQNVNFTLHLTDEGSRLYYELPPRSVNYAIERSKYLRVYTSGVSEKLMIEIKPLLDGDTVKINSIVINKPVPFMFSFLRCFIIFLVLFIYKAVTAPCFNRYIYDPRSRTQRYITIGVIAGVIVIFYTMTFQSTGYASFASEYNDLADAILNGQVYLEEVPDPALLEMENPYDYEYRKAVLKETGGSQLVDTAYYNGKYYVYFGVVPVLLLFLPYKLLFGGFLAVGYATFIICSLTVIAVFAFFSQIIKRYFKNTPFVIYVILSLSFLAGSGMILFISCPFLHAIPIVAALMFLLFGATIWLWFFNDKRWGAFKLFAGSLCMALTAGCRPQFLLAAFLFAFILFWDTVFKQRGLFSRKSLKNTIIFCVPFAFVGIGLMWYNFIRFGSVLDFGAAYNLTGTDMTKIRFTPAHLLFLWPIFFQPANVYLAFPFFFPVLENEIAPISMNVLNEAMFGGVFNNTLLLLNILMFRFKSHLKEKKLFALVAGSVLLSFFTAAYETPYGLFPRYTTDYAYLLFLPACIIVLMLIEVLNDTDKKTLYRFVAVSFFISVCFNLFPQMEMWVILWQRHVPNASYVLKHALEFWN